MLQVGIFDMDSYQMLWYGNYAKFYFREVQRKFNVVPQSIISVKFIQSMKWGQENESEIETYLIDSSTIFQKFMVAGVLFNMCLLRIDGISPSHQFDILSKEDGVLLKKLKVGKIRLATKQINSPESSIKESFTVYQDMLGKNNSLQQVNVFNIFEQTRTNLIGGQKTLSELVKTSDISIVVAQMDEIFIDSDTELQINDELTSETLLVKSITRSCFYFLQRIYFKEKVVAEGKLILCSYSASKNKLVPLPGKGFW